LTNVPQIITDYDVKFQAQTTSLSLDAIIFDTRWDSAIEVYCTSKISSNGCVPSMAASGLPSLTTPGNFSVTASQVETAQNGLIFFGTSGALSAPFQGGVLCVNPPLFRLNVQDSGGVGTCSGSLSVNLQDFLTHPTGGNLQVGDLVCAQAWFRDPAVPSTTGLSNALAFVIEP
jgi:hypothetical protein